MALWVALFIIATQLETTKPVALIHRRLCVQRPHFKNLENGSKPGVGNPSHGGPVCVGAGI